MATASKNKERHWNIVDAVNNCDSEAIAGIFAEIFMFHGKMGELHSLDEVHDYFQSLYDSFPDVTNTVKTVIVEGGLAVVRYTGTGTHEREYNDIEPTGEVDDFSGRWTVRIEDCKIVKAWGQTINLSLPAQLGDDQ